MQETAVEPSWLTYLPLISAGLAAAVSAAVALLVLYLNYRISTKRQVSTCAASLHSEITAILAALDRARESSPGGRTYSTVPFLTKPDQLMWAYRSLSQDLGLLSADVAHSVIEFYAGLTVVLPETAEDSSRYNNENLASLKTKGEVALGKLAQVSKRMTSILANGEGPAVGNTIKRIDGK